MARVELMPGIDSISGTVGKLTFRTVNGKTFVQAKMLPELPEKPNRKEKARYRRAVLIDNCVCLLQAEYPDIREAILHRRKIYDRVAYLYDKYRKTIKAPTKLMRKIMEEYHAKNQLISGDASKESRKCLENESRMTRRSSNRYAKNR